MIILAIETSCDDTGIAFLDSKKGKFKILSNIVSSQTKIHKKYGGVFPSLAKREHSKNLPVVCEKATREAGNPKADLIAVTQGPGLDPCLWTGINFAKEIAEKENIPLVPVNHIEAHILINFKKGLSKNTFPAICLVVSGGHTQLILMEKIGKYKIIGETRDDAAGECLDKTARILGLGYPGGPVISKKASLWNKKNKYKINLPRPMLNQKNYDFSFSGLKTAVLYDFKNRSEKGKKSPEYIKAICKEIQQAVIDVLLAKTLKAAREFGAKTIILGGGVSSNEELRKQFKEKIKEEKRKFMAPEPEFSTDNAAMVALTAHFKRKILKDSNWKKIKANANLRI